MTSFSRLLVLSLFALASSPLVTSVKAQDIETNPDDDDFADELDLSDEIEPITEAPGDASSRSDAEREEGEESEEGEVEIEDLEMEGVGVMAEAIEEEVPGAPQSLSEEDLETFEYDDPHSTFTRVPGVSVRGEDGYGLRPNIGLRGTSSDRSKRVTLLEDGILLTPAPYSAPAAYYFPLITRMVGIDVFKGPGALLYGPQTIGGAINMRAREFPEEGYRLRADVGIGRFTSRKIHLYASGANDWGGFMIEGVDVGTRGFKELDFGGTGEDDDLTTGFTRDEIIARGFLQRRHAGLYQRLELRFDFSREQSNETYLGLTDDDFRDSPYRRYGASALDNMTWWRVGARVDYRMEVGDNFDLQVTGYRHQFRRSWLRVNRFRNGPTLLDTLSNPDGGIRQVFYRVLSGQEDSASDDEAIMLIDNARRYVSRGMQAVANTRFETGEVFHDLRLGLLLHGDEIAREHVETGYLMQARSLVPDGRDPVTVTDNAGFAFAAAGHVAYRLEYRSLVVTPTARVEYVRNRLENDLTDEVQRGTQIAVLPGLAASLDVRDDLAVAVGVHRGYSPVAPGQPDEVEAETAWNYEAGARYHDDEQNRVVELNGFFKDYGNLSGDCSFASGCASDLVDRQFNGGAVFVWGAELLVGWTLTINEEYSIPLRGTYTYTGTRFRTEFRSDNPLFGEVSEGDALPYIPEHQGTIQAGISAPRWSANLSLNATGEMREQAGQGDDGFFTDRQFMLDVGAEAQVIENARVYLRVENVLNQRPLVSRRPFGARPAKPFSIMLGVKYEFQ